MKATKQNNTLSTIRFKAKLVAGIFTLPKSANTKLPKQSAVTVEGVINCLPFRAALEQDGAGSRCIIAKKAMSATIKVADGETTTVEITRANDEPEVRVPEDLLKALKAIPSAWDSWMDITPMARRDWIFSICSAKQRETRTRRIDKACDMLASGKRRLCCFPGIKWMMRENAKTCGMWMPLPSAKKASI